MKEKYKPCENTVRNTNDLSRVESLQEINKWWVKSTHLAVGGTDAQIYKAWVKLREGLMNYKKAVLFELYEEYDEDMLQSIEE